MSGTYVPDPTDATQPTEDKISETAAAEFRALKGRVNSLASGTVVGSGIQNILINGDFSSNPYVGPNVDFAQPATPAVLYFADMWNFGIGGTPANTVKTRLVFNDPATADSPPNYATYQRFTNLAPWTPTAAQFLEVCQYVEGINMRHMSFGTPAARASTVLFYCRSSVAGLRLCATLRHANSSRSRVFAFTLGAANTWQRFALQTTGDVAGSWPAGTIESAQITFTLAAGSTFRTPTTTGWLAGNFIGNTTMDNFTATPVNSTLDFTGFEWRPGSYNTANPVEIVPAVDIVKQVSRYYQTGLVINVAAFNAQPTLIAFGTLMRRAPIITFSGGALQITENSDGRYAGIRMAAGVNVSGQLTLDARLEVT